MIKKLLFGGFPLFFQDLSYALLRVATGVLMALLHGINKLPPSEKFVDGVSALGFPLPFLFAWCAGLAEFGGGLLLALGLLTRPAAFFVAFTMAVAAFGRHWNDPFSDKELSMVYLAIAFLFLVHGGGKWSLDRILFRSKSR